MRDFSEVNAYAVSMDRYVREWNPLPDERARLTDASVDAFLALLADRVDVDVVFVPHDLDANDAAAFDPSDRDLAWTIAHNFVHAAASAEEYAAVAAELARGVEFHGRPRNETPWQRIATVAQCRKRLEESRRIRLASLGMWPDRPDLTKGYAPWRQSGWVNAQVILAWGLAHDQGHLVKIFRQVTREPLGVGRFAAR